MLVEGKPTRTIWLDSNGSTVKIIDQTRLPHEIFIVDLNTLNDAAKAISDMHVRGAPLIRATAAYGMALAMSEDSSDAGLDIAYKVLYEARPTAVNLRWALDNQRAILDPLPENERKSAAYARAAEIADVDVVQCSSLGDHG